MTKSNEEIVLITGGSGFLGQHIIKLLLQEKDNLGIKEIRSIDLQPYTNEIGKFEMTTTDNVLLHFGKFCLCFLFYDIVRFFIFILFMNCQRSIIL